MARAGVISRFAPPLAVMALIWVLSAQPDLSSGLDSDLDLVLRKLAHMVVFGTLLATWWRAAGPRVAVAVTLAYAALDEWHQSWVEGRVGAASDWAIDALGAGIAAAIIVARLRRRRG
jgi:VanZ family protein